MSSNNNNNIPRIGNGTTPACAACKYQRRKCAPDCILAPYFPHDRQRQFLNAHKLFGVSNITKIIKNLSTPAEKDEAMRTIIIQSDLRASDPVGGCYRIIRELQLQIEYCQAELDLVLHHLAICRAQQQQQSAIDSATMAVGCLDLYSDPMLLQFHCGQQQPDHHHQEQQLQYQHHGYVVQETLQDGSSVNSWGMAAAAGADSSVSSSPPSLNIKHNSYDNECDEDDDIKPLLDINEVKFEAEELVERRFVPSTQLVISS